jgi:hypothetical protein
MYRLKKRKHKLFKKKARRKFFKFELRGLIRRTVWIKNKQFAYAFKIRLPRNILKTQNINLLNRELKVSNKNTSKK